MSFGLYAWYLWTIKKLERWEEGWILTQKQNLLSLFETLSLKKKISRNKRCIADGCKFRHHPLLLGARATLDWSTVKISWPHLHNVPIDGESPAVAVMVLICVSITDAQLQLLHVFKAPALVPNAPKGVLTPFGWIIKGAIDVDCHPAPFIPSISNEPLSINGLSPKFERQFRGEMWETNLLVSHPLSSDDRRHQS